MKLVQKCLLGLFLISSVAQLSATTLKLKIVDFKTGKLVPARVLIKSNAGKSFVPLNAISLKIGKEIWFMSPGTSVIKINSEEVMIRVERGKEYIRIKSRLKLNNKKEIVKKIILHRWINMKKLGYLSGENHLHQPPDKIAANAAAEDLNYASILDWWNGTRFAIPKGTSNIRKLKFGKIIVPTAVYDVETEDNWGASYLFDNPKPFPLSVDPKRPHLFDVKYGKEVGALVCYQSGWSREVLIDALLGYVDVVNVCNNNFHMHRYQPRSRYSNLLNVKDFPIYPNTPVGMMKMNTDTYYRLLNCGLKLAAGAGSASGVKETPVGYNRAYVRCSAKDGFSGFVKAWRAGKNFVTNGPMLFLKTSEGLQPGNSLNISGSKKVVLDVKAISDSPLGSVEIVINGKVAKSFPVEKGVKKFKGSYTLSISKSSWICARCTDTDMLLTNKELEEYRSPRVHLFQDPNRLRYAHTSPIYFYVNGKGIAVKKSIKEGLEMIDAFKKFAKKNSSEKYLNTILNSADKAKEILNKKLK